MGANIVTDDFFSVGDVINYNGIEGKVISFGLKTTKIQDLATGNILTITNRSITEATKLSNNLYIEIPIPYELSMERIGKITSNIVEEVKKGEYIEDCKCLGISNFKDSYISCYLTINAMPEYKYTNKRVAIAAIKNEFDKNDISIPYPQLTVHNE